MADVDVRPGTVAVFSDVLCPWATLALHRFYDARDRAGLTSDVRVDHGLFFLEDVNRRPSPKATLDSEIPVVGALAPELDWHVWQGAPETFPVTSGLANEAVQAAKAQDLRAAEQLDFALRMAFFRDGRCISLRHVVLEVARTCDHVDARAIERALDTGTGRGALMQRYFEHREVVTASPHFFFADGSDLANPGIEMHWVGVPGEGFVVVDADTPEIYDELVRRAAGLAVS